MKPEDIQKAIEVVNGYSDIKELIGGYSCHVRSAQYNKQANHPLLNFSGTTWTRERLNNSVEWHEKIAGLVAEKLVSLGINVYDAKFWDDTIFSPIEGLSYKKLKDEKIFELVEDDYNLEKDLEMSKQIRKLVKDDKFAQALYAALCNVGWRKNGIEWGCSWRYSGGLVADLRGVGEDYLDFYCSGIGDGTKVPEGHVDCKVREELAKLNWFPNESDIQRNLGF